MAAGKAGALTETGQIVLEHDPEVTLNRLFKDFVVKARTVLYHLFSITKFLGHDLSFFQRAKDEDFEKDAAQFLVKVPGRRGDIILSLLRGDRQSWGPLLIDVRNKMIHEPDCPSLRVLHVVEKKAIRAVFSTVQCRPIVEFTQLLWDNLFEFVEDVEVLLLGLHLNPGLVVLETDPGQRVNNDPAKYKLTMRPANVPPEELVIRCAPSGSDPR